VSFLGSRSAPRRSVQARCPRPAIQAPRARPPRLRARQTPGRPQQFPTECGEREACRPSRRAFLAIEIVMSVGCAMYPRRLRKSLARPAQGDPEYACRHRNRAATNRPREASDGLGGDGRPRVRGFALKRRWTFRPFCVESRRFQNSTWPRRGGANAFWRVRSPVAVRNFGLGLRRPWCRIPVCIRNSNRAYPENRAQMR